MSTDSGKSNELTQQGFWDDVSATRIRRDDTSAARGHRADGLLRRLGGDHSWAMTLRVLRKHLPRDASLRLLEVGCAPGELLTSLCSALGYQPFGLEYAPAGVEETRRTFLHNGLPLDNIVLGDLFDPAIHREYNETYDVVSSFGLIEHFDDPTEAIRCHLKLLRPGGYLVIQIPKLAGISLLSMWLFRREFIAQHNRAIMTPQAFAKLFNDHSVESLFCGHVGFIKLYGLFSRREHSLRGFGARVADRVQVALSAAQRIGFLGRNVTWPWSPTLLYVGRKPFD